MKKDNKQKKELREKRKQAVDQWFEKYQKLTAVFWMLLILTVLVLDVEIAVRYPEYFKWYLSLLRI